MITSYTSGNDYIELVVRQKTPFYVPTFQKMQYNMVSKWPYSWSPHTDVLVTSTDEEGGQFRVYTVSKGPSAVAMPAMSVSFCLTTQTFWHAGEAAQPFCKLLSRAHGELSIGSHVTCSMSLLELVARGKGGFCEKGHTDRQQYRPRSVGGTIKQLWNSSPPHTLGRDPAQVGRAGMIKAWLSPVM